MSKPSVIEYQALFTHKRGNELRHYEDAFALEGVSHVAIEGGDITVEEDRLGAVQVESNTWRCAVADGATQGGFSKLWAQMLVDHFIPYDNMSETPQLESDLTEVEHWLRYLSHKWSTEKVDEILNTVPSGSPRRGRMQQTLLLEGQAATLATLELDLASMQWRTTVLGDAFLFHYRGDNQGNGEVQPGTPFRDTPWEDLDTNPVLISSHENNQNQWIWNNTAHFRREDAYAEGRYRAGDYFLLMSDAIATWFLRQISGDAVQRQEALRRILNFTDNSDFKAWVEKCRSLPREHPHHIKNDDMTLVIVRPVHADGSNRVVHAPQLVSPRRLPSFGQASDRIDTSDKVPDATSPQVQLTDVQPGSVPQVEEHTVQSGFSETESSDSVHTKPSGIAGSRPTPPTTLPEQPAKQEKGFEAIDDDEDTLLEDPERREIDQWLSKIRKALNDDDEQTTLRIIYAHYERCYIELRARERRKYSYVHRDIVRWLPELKENRMDFETFQLLILVSEQRLKIRRTIKSDRTTHEKAKTIESSFTKIHEIPSDTLSIWKNVSNRRKAFLNLVFKDRFSGPEDIVSQFKTLFSR
jgi:hypothetical protein